MPLSIVISSNDFAPHIYRTRDLGKSWQEITRGLPRDGYVHFVKEDPKRRGMLFAGTERSVFISFDDGENWQSLQLNLPATSVRDIEIHGDDAVLATHGRGFWVLDDIGSLRQISAATAQSTAVLFKPTDALAIVQGGDNGTPWQKDEPQAENAPVGAVIDYYLKSAASGPVVIDILNAAGKVVRTYSSAAPRSGADGAANGVGAVGAPADDRSDIRGHASLGLGSARTAAGRRPRRRWWWRRIRPSAADADRIVHRALDREWPDPDAAAWW